MELPQKTREQQNHHQDGTIWNDLEIRDDDVIIATYGKTGTTWTQQIVGQLLSNGDPLVGAAASPWVELRVPPKEVKKPELDAMPSRRYLKTHLPLDALVFSPKAKYIYVGRDGRDVVWSLFNHHINANDMWYSVLNDTPGRVGPPIERPANDVHQYYQDWMDKDGHPLWPFWDNARTWWEHRHQPNVLFVHFANLKRDMPGEMRRIAAFMGAAVDESKWAQTVEHCTFAYMKEHAGAIVPAGGAFWDGGADVFMNKGVNGRWADTLSQEEVRAYEARAEAELGADCARWFATGEGM
eukprot:CAMPEP_0173195960 /NCGR_PEP_ID=MMETSP1141-20130122/15345_1 /TAXON_ID=483371 /ORGANISM="non described non described, Strain CCMP2298" /LENGTH=296 /DNA_ID=CAMNT_0014120547 /DNA_START=27 /DNA_END=917 /DNA_ORIENTATION=+